MKGKSNSGQAEFKLNYTYGNAKLNSKKTKVNYTGSGNPFTKEESNVSNWDEQAKRNLSFI